MTKSYSVCIIGTGYVGLSTGAILAYLGHKVICVDINQEKIAKLQLGEIPFHEPHLKELLAQSQGNLQFTTNLEASVKTTQIGFITVGTPAKADGSTDLSYIIAAAQAIGKSISKEQNYLIVNKSTVPIGTGHYVHVIAEKSFQENHGVKSLPKQICVASNPEFLREGSAVYDSLYPNRVVLGVEEASTLEMLKQLYEPLLLQTFNAPVFSPRSQNQKQVPLVSTNRTSAETIKYAANTFLALKVSFINQVAGLCELVGADVTEVAHGIGLDERIGSRFLRAGIGWGGSCFGKDTRALISTANEFNYDMSILRAVLDANKDQHFTVVEKLQRELKVLKGKKISILGLSFKPETDDVRDAPATAIIKELLHRGVIVSVHDPVSMPAWKQMNPNLDVIYIDQIEGAFMESEAIVLITEWSIYKALDRSKFASLMDRRLVIDGRNFLDRSALVKGGFKYIGVGTFEGV